MFSPVQALEADWRWECPDEARESAGAAPYAYGPMIAAALRVERLECMAKTGAAPAESEVMRMTASGRWHL